MPFPLNGPQEAMYVYLRIHVIPTELAEISVNSENPVDAEGERDRIPDNLRVQLDPETV
jgi:hypothetical protein